MLDKRVPWNLGEKVPRLRMVQAQRNHYASTSWVGLLHMVHIELERLFCPIHPPHKPPDTNKKEHKKLLKDVRKPSSLLY
jgi:hypothetical protein